MAVQGRRLGVKESESEHERLGPGSTRTKLGGAIQGQAASWTWSLQVGSHRWPRGETPMEHSTPQEIFPVRIVCVFKLFLFVLVVIYFMSKQSHVSWILQLMKRQGISFTWNFGKISKTCKGSSSLKAYLMARPEAKHARICSTTRRRADSQALEKFLRHAKAHQVSKPVLWRDQKPSVPGSARPREGEQNPKHWRIY